MMRAIVFSVAGFWLLASVAASTSPDERRSNAEWLGDHDGGQLTVIANDSALETPHWAAVNAATKGGKVGEFRLGFVNFRRIMASVPQLDAIRNRLEHEFGAEEKSLMEAQSDLAISEQKLSKMERGDAYSAYEKQVIAKRRDVARRDAAFRDSFSVRRNEELAKLQKLIADEIIALAKTSGYDIILNDTGVFYVSERADLSSIVIERLKKKAGENQP